MVDSMERTWGYSVDCLQKGRRKIERHGARTLGSLLPLMLVDMVVSEGRFEYSHERTASSNDKNIGTQNHRGRRIEQKKERLNGRGPNGGGYGKGFGVNHVAAEQRILDSSAR
jgi:hypothetical protein